MPCKAELVSNGTQVRIKGRTRHAKRMRKWATKPGLWLVPAKVACEPGWCKRHGVDPVPAQIAALACRPPKEPSDAPMPIAGLYPYQRDAIRTIVGTLALCQTLGHLLKMLAYASVGFGVLERPELLWPLVISVIVGTFAGRWLHERVSDSGFRRVFKFILLTLSLKLAYDGLQGLGWLNWI